MGEYTPGSGLAQVLTDRLGSVRALAGAAGVTSTADYDAFGNAVGGLTGRFGWGGREFDAETGQYHGVMARQYDPRLGRWASPDPIGFLGGETSLYRFNHNDPVNGGGPHRAVVRQHRRRQLRPALGQPGHMEPRRGHRRLRRGPPSSCFSR